MVVRHWRTQDKEFKIFYKSSIFLNYFLCGKYFEIFLIYLFHNKKIVVGCFSKDPYNTLNMHISNSTLIHIDIRREFHFSYKKRKSIFVHAVIQNHFNPMIFLPVSFSNLDNFQIFMYHLLRVIYTLAIPLQNIE